jgi:peptidoglycan DL-endopeptidase LytE
MPFANTIKAEAATTSTVTSLQSKQKSIVSTAERYLGVPYKFGALSSQAPHVFDCSSYVQYVFKRNGITLPRDSRQQSTVGTRVTKANLQPGDLMFFIYPEKYSDARVGHVAIYIGNGKMIHAIPNKGVVVTNWTSSSYWTKNFLYAKRVVHK